jgi:hypothetical protein
MSETINLDQNNRQVVRGIVKASSVTCSMTSAADVYVHVISKDDTAELYKGDGTVIPKATRTRFYIFRKNPGNSAFSATVGVTDLPDDPAKKANMVTALNPVKPKKVAKAKKSTKPIASKAKASKPKKTAKKSGGRSKG